MCDPNLHKGIRITALTMFIIIHLSLCLSNDYLQTSLCAQKWPKYLRARDTVWYTCVITLVWLLDDNLLFTLYSLTIHFFYFLIHWSKNRVWIGKQRKRSNAKDTMSEVINDDSSYTFCLFVLIKKRAE